MNIIDLSKDIRYSISLFLQPKDLISFALCNKKMYQMVIDETFWFRKLCHDYTNYSIPPPNITLRRWYELVYIMINIEDCYDLEELYYEPFSKNKYEETAILFMACAYRGHLEIQDALCKIHPNICELAEKSLPLTPKEFIYLDDVVKYLKSRKNN